MFFERMEFDGDSPFHDCFSSSVAVQSSEFSLLLLHNSCHTVGEVLPAICDHVPVTDVQFILSDLIK